MNPKLVKFAVEMQTCEQEIKEKEEIYFNKKGGLKLFNLFKVAKVSVPVKETD